MSRREIIEAIYRNIYKDRKERKRHLDVLEEVIEQDKIIHHLRRSGNRFTELELKELLSCRNAIHVCNSARKYKYA